MRYRLYVFQGGTCGIMCVPGWYVRYRLCVFQGGTYGIGYVCSRVVRAV